ncbi:hypothetical protein V6N12_020257 [Hibiscus sabdariffa]|uniref:Uncharacterized protein n=1 Tax=Hibiscus sabdariffa TaxID=183260 RepID=A0ABR1ZF54_9ROSI
MKAIPELSKRQKEISGFFAQATEEGNQHEREVVTKEAKLQMSNTKDDALLTQLQRSMYELMQPTKM